MAIRTRSSRTAAAVSVDSRTALLIFVLMAMMAMTSTSATAASGAKTSVIHASIRRFATAATTQKATEKTTTAAAAASMLAFMHSPSSRRRRSGNKRCFETKHNNNELSLSSQESLLFPATAVAFTIRSGSPLLRGSSLGLGSIIGNNNKYIAAALFSSSSDAAQDESSAASLATKTLAKQPSDVSEDSGGGSSNGNSDSSEYHVYESEQTIKKSQFIGMARYADDWKDASAFVETIRTKIHPKARHWCFAYRGSIVGGGDGDDGELSRVQSDATSTTITERASDDGEPSGTAGQPILNALRTETDAAGGLIDAVVVVVRYSGGIKLGAGGLIRAYGGTARMVLQDHTDMQVGVIPKTVVALSNVQPKHVGVVYDLAAKHGATVSSANEDYTGFFVTCDARSAGAFRDNLMDATRGSVVIR